MKKLLLTTLTALFIFNTLSAQNTVGLLSYDPSKAFDGYNLLYPHNQPNVYLIDNCGEIVHVWEDSTDYRPGNTAYLLFNGNILKTKRPASIVNDPIWAGGGGAIVEIRTWDNDLLWSYELNNENFRLHHDIDVTNDGNILMIAWEKKTMEEAIQAGRDTALIPDGEVWSDMIIEVDPYDSQIVWEWHAWDHLIQDFDPTKDNYGVVADHPELIDINYTSNDGGQDWIHGNAIDVIYDPIQGQDQVLFSTPFLSELWVIDHTTTTQEAAGHTGGSVGRGGDLIYRWGNPQVYDRGTADDQKLFNNHDVQWVNEFLPANHPYYGKFAMFNNQAGPDYSSFNIMTPPWDMYNNQYEMDGDTWGPIDFDVDLTHPDGPQTVYSTGLSSVQVLPNNNMLVCSGRQGYSFELTMDGEIVWEYVTPLIAGQPATQGDTLELNNNLTFRMKRYPADYQAFNNRDLSGKGWIELEPDTNFCFGILNPVNEGVQNYQLEVYPNPATDQLVIEWEGGVYVDVDVLDLMGRPVLETMRLTGGRKFLDISALQNGVYFVCVNGEETRKVVVSR